MPQIRTYRFFGTRSYSLLQPNHTNWNQLVPLGTTVILHNFLDEFIQRLHNLPTLDITGSTDQEISVNLRTNALAAFLGPGGQPPRSPGNPIQGIFVWKSRPSGDPSVWRPDGAFWLHPTTTPIGAAVPLIAVAQEPLAALQPSWISAAVGAYPV